MHGILKHSLLTDLKYKLKGNQNNVSMVIGLCIC